MQFSNDKPRHISVDLLKTSVLEALKLRKDEDVVYAGVTSCQIFDNLFDIIPPEERFTDKEFAEAGIRNIKWHTWVNNSLLWLPTIFSDRDLAVDSPIRHPFYWFSEDNFNRYPDPHERIDSLKTEEVKAAGFMSFPYLVKVSDLEPF